MDDEKEQETTRQLPIRDYVCIDLEATGLIPKRDRIIELGAVKVRDAQIVDRFQSLVNPGRRLDPEIEALTGIKSEELTQAPPITKVLPRFLQFIDAHILVGHSVYSDYVYLKRAAVNLGLPLEAEGIDTLRLSREYLKDQPSRSLKDLCLAFGIPHVAHRALGDAEATAALYELLCSLYYRSPEETPGFAPKVMVVKVKREGPASQAQKERLLRVAADKGIRLTLDVDMLTRNEVSRLTDQILSGCNSYFLPL